MNHRFCQPFLLPFERNALSVWNMRPLNLRCRNFHNYLESFKLNDFRSLVVSTLILWPFHFLHQMILHLMKTLFSCLSNLGSVLCVVPTWSRFFHQLSSIRLSFLLVLFYIIVHHFLTTKPFIHSMNPVTSKSSTETHA